MFGSVLNHVTDGRWATGETTPLASASTWHPVVTVVSPSGMQHSVAYAAREADRHVRKEQTWLLLPAFLVCLARGHGPLSGVG